MIKEALQRTGRRALMRKPHTVRFMGSSREPYPLRNGRLAIASARSINGVERRRGGRVLAYVDGPAFAGFQALRAAWDNERPELGFFGRELYDLIVNLVAYGEMDVFRDKVLRSTYYQGEIKKLKPALRTELENLLSQ